MIHRVPDYYKQFVCKASSCKRNCCREGWYIEIDEETRKRLCTLRGTKNVDLNPAQTFEERDGIYLFKQRKGACIWLEKSGLCGLLGTYGEEYTADVCRLFPRYSEYFANVKESGLGLACEEAARLIFTYKKSKIYEQETDEEPYEDPEYDKKRADVIMFARELMEKMISTESIGDLMRLYLYIGDGLQEALNERDFTIKKSDITETIKKAKKFKYNSKTDLYKEVHLLIEQISKLPDIRTDLKNLLEYLKEDFSDIKILDFDFYKLNEYKTNYYRAYIRYFLFRYFSKSIYDFDVKGKGRLIVVFTAFMRLCDISFMKRNGHFSELEEMIELAGIISRELEYSDSNMEALSEAFIFEDCFSTQAVYRLSELF